jgi:DNA mismatch repair protein MutL
MALQTSGNGARREVLGSMFGVDIARQMLEVRSIYESLAVEGFISPVGLTRSNRSQLTFFVNGRWVQDAALASALLQAYHTLIMVGRYPIAVLFLALSPEAVDVNVHPAKAEVRFSNKDEVFSGVRRAVRQALLAYTPVPEIMGQMRWAPIPDKPNQSSIIQPEDTNTLETSQPFRGMELPSDQQGVSAERVPLLRAVGQIGSAYLVAEGPDGLYLVDQHAAHERVLFERLMAQRGTDIHGQILLEPVTVNLTPSEARLLETQLCWLRPFGFQVDEFGPNTFQVRAIPALLSGSDPAAALRVLVEDFEEDETPLQAEIEARIIARVCKRAAVKAGQSLTLEEQRALLHDLEATQSPRSCPHGRPTMIHLSIEVLERQFGRRGAR